MTAHLDAGNASRVILEPAERHRVSVVRGDNGLHLSVPVADELGHVRPNLAGLPLLCAAGIRIRQPGRCLGGGMPIQPLLDGVQPRHEVRAIEHRGADLLFIHQAGHDISALAAMIVERFRHLCVNQRRLGRHQ